METALVRAMVAEVERRTGRSFAAAFRAQDVTDFLFSLAWICSRGDLEDVYASGRPRCPVVWPGHPDLATLRREIDESERPRAPFLTVHQRAPEDFDAERAAVLGAVWVRVGLFASTEEAAAFVARFRDAPVRARAVPGCRHGRRRRRERAVTSRSNERVAQLFDAHAGSYDQQMDGAERWLLGHHRRWATSRASGEVLELAVGTGLNLALYGEEVRSVLGLDLSEAMLDRARARIAEHHLGDRSAVRRGDAQALDLPDASRDTVLATYSLCTIAGPGVALAQARRVLRPGGSLVLVDHGLSRSGLGRLVQRALNPATLRWQSDDLLLQPRLLVEAAGFEVLEADQVGRAGLVHRVHAVRPGSAR